MEKPNYLVFLDIDGVLASARVFESNPVDYIIWSQFDPVAVAFLNRLHDTYVGVQFVVMSTWKNHVSDSSGYHWMESSFRNAGFRGEFHPTWRTDPDDSLPHKDRAYQVKEFLEQHTPIDFILFDDNSFRFKEILGISRLILTNPADGLLHKHMLNALSLTGTWKKR